MLSQQLLLELPSRAGGFSAAEFARTLTSGGITATIGQHHDLAGGDFAAGTAEQALATARLKAGALAGAACRLGAMVGTTDPALLDLYGRWGRHFGTVAQLANDLHDALDTDDKSDLARGKSTLPLLFKRGTAATVGMIDSGALHFTWVVVEIERQSCREIVEQLAARGQDVATLRRLIS